MVPQPNPGDGGVESSELTERLLDLRRSDTTL